MFWSEREKVRAFRAMMTRLKVAQDFDLGVGYTAVPIANPGTGPAYKLRYGLGRTTTVEDLKPDPLVTPVV